jgi:NO-binding membrane sensor protein with MHYT domain
VGSDHIVSHLQDFSYGIATPALSYAIASVGALLGLRAATRARACEGASRTRWLLLAGFAVGGIGIWATGFAGLLGLAVPGETTRYSVTVTIASLLVAVLTVTAGLLVTGSGAWARGPVIAGSLIAGLGLAATQYLGAAAIRMPVRLSYQPALFVLSIAISFVAAGGIMWAAVRLRRVWAAVGAALLLGIASSGVHDTAAAALRVSNAAGPAGMVIGGGGGATAASCALPLILAASIASFLVWTAVALAPTEDAIRYDAALLAHVRRRSQLPLDAPKAAPPPYGQPTDDAAPWTFAELRRPPGPR